jgi:hypothetical protein
MVARPKSAIDKSKIAKVAKDLHTEMRKDPKLRADFAINPVKVLNQRGLGLDEIVEYYASRGVAPTLDSDIGLSC